MDKVAGNDKQSTGPIVVFGGTGFLGRRVVRTLDAMGRSVVVAARHPNAVDFAELKQKPQRAAVDITVESQVRAAMEGAWGVVNAVSLYVEKGNLTFDVVHVDGAERIARCAREAGVKQLVHISGLGIEKNSPSRFVQARARGEEVVAEQFPRAVFVRPSVMFGCDDAFLSSLNQVTHLPVIPLFGNGETQLQPAYVEDVAKAVAQLVREEEHEGIYELGGGKAYRYREAVKAVKEYKGRKGVLVPVSFRLWHTMVRGLNLLPNPPLTQDQLFLMGRDNIPTPGAPGFSELSIQPRALEELFGECLD